MMILKKKKSHNNPSDAHVAITPNNVAPIINSVHNNVLFDLFFCTTVMLGHPQCGQLAASLLISFPHSLHLIIAMKRTILSVSVYTIIQRESRRFMFEWGGGYSA